MLFSEIRSFDRGGPSKTSIGGYFSPPQARTFSGGSTKGLISGVPLKFTPPPWHILDILQRDVNLSGSESLRVV